LKVIKGKNDFTKDDIKLEMQNAAEPIPANLTRDIKWAIGIGFIAKKDQQDDTFYVTTTGQDAVEKGFPDELIKKTKLSRRTSSKRNGKKEENEN
jgi:hypothetical protein